MNIALTGTTGFIGKNLAKALQKQGHAVVAIVRPSSNTTWLDKANIKYHIFNGDIEALAEFLQKNTVEGVIHLASLFLAKHELQDIPQLIESNLLFSTQVLEASTLAKVSWFINTGTAWQHYENETYNPVNLYAATKQAFEDIAKYYYETRPIKFATLQLHDTFGPGDTRPKIFNLWKKVAASGEKLSMSQGEQIIDISYIDNVVDAFICLVDALSSKQKSVKNGTVYVVSSPERMSLKSLAAVFEDVSGTTLNIGWGEREYREREVMKPWSKGVTVPGWAPKTTLKEGIKKTLADS